MASSHVDGSVKVYKFNSFEDLNSKHLDCLPDIYSKITCSLRTRLLFRIITSKEAISLGYSHVLMKISFICTIFRSVDSKVFRRKPKICIARKVQLDCKYRVDCRRRQHPHSLGCVLQQADHSNSGSPGTNYEHRYQQ